MLTRAVSHLRQILLSGFLWAPGFPVTLACVTMGSKSHRKCPSSSTVLSTGTSPSVTHMMETRTAQNGLFVVIEGADRTGKSTQAKMLSEALTTLTAKKCLYLKFPDRTTPLGQCLNEYLVGKRDMDPHALHLLFTANRWERDTELRAALSNGCSVVADRYTYSGIAYTAAKVNPTPDWHWCCQMEKGLLEPDIVICLTPDNIEDLHDRSGYGEERYETDDFQKRVLKNYLRLSEEAKATGEVELAPDQPEWHFVQATHKSVEEVHKCIISIVKDKLSLI
ncbi:Thymidylate kinase/adenylate kinase [Fasciola gigantica]|uniref:dTMP kinase n=1 Tax=Fasciola gigantica TaxID=46835 RepID=A0A504XDP9_FASGI|nr:Thymidylate kinase/adenylate kinase [Fasciola gigantica]